VSRQKADGVDFVLHEPARSLVQSELIGRISRRSWIVYCLDRRMCEQHDGHAALTAQPIERGKKGMPPFIDDAIASAVAGRFNRRPAVCFTQSRPDQPFELVERVHDDSAEFVRFAAQRGESVAHVVVTCEQPKRRKLQTTWTTILALQKNRRGKFCRKSGLADPFRTVEEHARRQCRSCDVDVSDRFHRSSSSTASVSSKMRATSMRRLANSSSTSERVRPLHSARCLRTCVRTASKT